MSEILMTMILQAGFILTLFGAFYLMMEFYTKTQAVLTARDHAERVIQFMDDKIRAAGLGLWRCDNPVEIQHRVRNIAMLDTHKSPPHFYKLPISITWNDGKMEGILDDLPLASDAQKEGDVLTLLYAQRDLSSGEDYEVISTTAEATNFTPDPFGATLSTASMKLLDSSSKNTGLLRNESLFDFTGTETNIKNYGVMESVGVPMYLDSVTSTHVIAKVYRTTTDEADSFTVPAASEFLALKCMQMFVHDKNDGLGRQFAFRELKNSGTAWDSKNNQEMNILDIYMELDTSTNIFTLYVLATGGYDAGVTYDRPASWPKEATPAGTDRAKAEEAWKAHDYSHHTVYVSRASWKLNNLENFSWN